jgi:Tol biopolymer transport system component
MKIKFRLAIWILIAGLPTAATPAPAWSALKGPYLGQKPPGLAPELFAPGTVSRSDYFEHSAALFSPDGKEVYWSAKPNSRRYYQIYVMRMEDGVWSQPEVAEFCSPSESYETFMLSRDGKKLFFRDSVGYNGGLQFVEKVNGTWSRPKPAPRALDSGANECIWSILPNGSVYFIRRSGDSEVFVARPAAGDYATPEKLGPQINTSFRREGSVYVAPDESYMIIEASSDGASAELFASFRAEDGAWSEQIKLPIRWARFPSVSPDGKYLFFMTHEGIYWVSAKIIDDLNPRTRSDSGRGSAPSGKYIKEPARQEFRKRLF